ncbi:MAG: tetratricopeptide repeat protein, partial [Pseudomonadota bacterium]
MRKDSFGNTITTSSDTALDAFHIYGKDWLGYGTRVPKIFEAADADPGCAYLNAHAAAAHMGLEAAAGYRAAKPYLDRALQYAPDGTEREQMFVEAVDAWWHCNPQRTLKLQREIARQWPRDLVAAKWGQYYCFNLGEADGMLEIAESVLPYHRDVPQAHGMHAFGLEQCHRLEEAEEAGRKAVSMQRAEPWAHHAVAHVMETQGRIEEGIQWMRSHSETWEDRSIFMRGHNWWHLALFLMDVEDYDGALDIFDERLWGVWPEFGQEQIGAISMLWRLEMRGLDVGNRWAAIAAKVAERELEHVQPFHDMHYIFALARAGQDDQVSAFLSSMEQHAARRDE